MSANVSATESARAGRSWSLRWICGTTDGASRTRSDARSIADALHRLQQVNAARQELAASRHAERAHEAERRGCNTEDVDYLDIQHGRDPTPLLPASFDERGSTPPPEWRLGVLYKLNATSLYYFQRIRIWSRNGASTRDPDVRESVVAVGSHANKVLQAVRGPERPVQPVRRFVFPHTARLN